MNIKNCTYRFIAILMAFLVLLTSIGFNIDMHFCGGQLKNISFTGKAESCHKNSMADCPFHKKMMAENGGKNFTSKNCCSNHTAYFQTDLIEDIQTMDIVVTSQLQQFVTAFVLVFLQNQVVETTPSTFTAYSPPDISRDIPVLIQSFLI